MVGALLIFGRFKNSNKVINSSLAFASGVMLTISITDLIPSSISGFLTYYYVIPSLLFALIFVILGIIVSTLINKYIPDINTTNIDEKQLFKVGIITMAAIVLHNLPEGIATFITTTQDPYLGLSLALAITMHNIPEGISIAIPIYYSTKSKFKALSYTFVSCVSEPIGAIIAYWFLAPYVNGFIMSIIFALIAGIMLSISIYELIPGSLKYGSLNNTIKYFLLGVAFMCICHFII